MGVTHYKWHELRNTITFFQVTSKVTHYFLIYRKISELLFQKSNPSCFVFPFIENSALCEHALTVVLD